MRTVIAFFLSFLSASLQTSIVVDLPAAVGRRWQGGASTKCFGEELALHELMVVRAEAIEDRVPAPADRRLIHLAVEVRAL